MNSQIFENKKNFFAGTLIAFFVALLDLLSKKIIFASLEKLAVEHGTNQAEVRVFDFFNLVSVWNRGVSFGMFDHLENGRIIFSAIQSVLILILFFWLYSNRKLHFTYALGLIIGGALGNLIDRIQNGAVADFLDFHISFYHWPAFNLADSCIFIGVMILIFDEIFFEKNGKKIS